MSKSAGLKRIQSKSKGAVYNNASWDLVDAKDKDGDGVFDKLDKTQLHDSLKTKSTAEIQRIVKEKSLERSNVKKEITTLNVQRDAYIAAEKAKKADNKNNAPTLETEVEKIIKEQAKRFNMKID